MDLNRRREQKGGEKCMIRGFTTYRGDKIKENETGLECSIYGSNEKCIQYFSQKIVRRRKFGRPRCRLEDVLEWILKRKDGWC